MRVNSDETMRRASAYRAAHGNPTWLQLARDSEQKRHSGAFFTGGLPRSGSDRRGG